MTKSNPVALQECKNNRERLNWHLAYGVGNKYDRLNMSDDKPNGPIHSERLFQAHIKAGRAHSALFALCFNEQIASRALTKLLAALGNRINDVLTMRKET